MTNQLPSAAILVAGLLCSASAADHNWMAGISDTTPVSRISIPGTHDSGARFETFPGTAKCQNSTIAEQLGFGIRLLDIRCRHVNNAFAIYHGTENQNLTYTEVLDQVIAFLTTNPTEVVMMSVKEEGKSSGATRSFEATFDSYVAANPSKWALGTTVPNLSAVRGKIMLIRRFGATTAKGINATNWPKNRSFKANNLTVQDMYQVGDNTVKWNAIHAALSTAKTATDSAILRLNFTSGYQPSFLGIPNIPAVSNAINPRLTHYFTGAAAGHYGCLLMDFADAALTELIYQTNFPRLPPASSASPVTGTAATTADSESR